MTDTGLVLSGGGARAAYQVGAISALTELLKPTTTPFSVLAGVSAGAINSTALACRADDFPRATRELRETWLSLTPDAVYRTDGPKLALLGARWLRDLTTGGALTHARVNHLLDTAPLREMLSRRIEVARIPHLVENNLLRGVALSVTNYLTGTNVTFFDATTAVKPWLRHDRVAFRARLSIEHIMASSAIPLFFPPVSIDGKIFGDGGMRMTTPLSPAIHLGATKVVAIGIRHARTPQQTLELNRGGTSEQVSVAQIGGVLLNALFLDALDNDVERLQRINRTLSMIPSTANTASPDRLRPIPALLLRPSQDLGRLAADEYSKFPALLRHLLRGIGATRSSGWDLLSYLAFLPPYVAKLMELGYDDTYRRRNEIVAFMDS